MRLVRNTIAMLVALVVVVTVTAMVRAGGNENAGGSLPRPTIPGHGSIEPGASARPGGGGCEPCVGDVDGDCDVDFDDLILVLANWGPCQEPTGACCIDEFEMFCDVLTRRDCEDIFGGTYLGDGTDCGDCFPGTCCLPDASPCRDGLTPNECEAIGGSYLGNDANCFRLCPGACCLTSGECARALETTASRFGGIFFGTGTSCDGIECGFGACCLPGGECLEMSRAVCTGNGGDWLGEGTSCDVNCGFGACCLPDGRCVPAEDQGECENQGGKWQGEGVSCDDVEC